MISVLRQSRGLLFVLGVIALLLGASVVVVPETSQLVVLRDGQPLRVINRYVPRGEPGSGVPFRVAVAEPAT